MYDLLDNSWASFKNEFALEWFWRLEEAGKIEASCTDSDIIRKIQRYKEENLGPKGLTDYAIHVAEEHPKAFNYKFDPSKFEPYKQKQIERWNDFNTVIDRLNAPELVDKYQKLNFIYDAHFRKTATAKSMFKKKIGNCFAHVQFAKYALKKADYRVKSLGVRNVVSGMGLQGIHIPMGAGTGPVYYHRTTAFKALDDNGDIKWFILDNAWKLKAKGIHGPFNSTYEIRKWYNLSSNVNIKN